MGREGSKIIARDRSSACGKVEGVYFIVFYCALLSIYYLLMIIAIIRSTGIIACTVLKKCNNRVAVLIF